MRGRERSSGQKARGPVCRRARGPKKAQGLVSGSSFQVQRLRDTLHRDFRRSEIRGDHHVVGMFLTLDPHSGSDGRDAHIGHRMPGLHIDGCAEVDRARDGVELRRADEFGYRFLVIDAGCLLKRVQGHLEHGIVVQPRLPLLARIRLVSICELLAGLSGEGGLEWEPRMPIDGRCQVQRDIAE